jgi:hypothetical protein
MGIGESESGGETRARGWKPVLGLSDDPAEPRPLPARPGSVFDQPEPEELLELTVIVPARNEAECLGGCLQSLVSQSDEVFALGRDWELVVVDDHSADRTAEIARRPTNWRRAGRARITPSGRRRGRRGGAGCYLRTRTRFMSRGTCTGPCMRRHGTRLGC